MYSWSYHVCISPLIPPSLFSSTKPICGNVQRSPINIHQLCGLQAWLPEHFPWFNKSIDHHFLGQFPYFLLAIRWSSWSSAKIWDVQRHSHFLWWFVDIIFYPLQDDYNAAPQVISWFINPRNYTIGISMLHHSHCSSKPTNLAIVSRPQLWYKTIYKL